jgi:hypothetical protein
MAPDARRDLLVHAGNTATRPMIAWLFNQAVDADAILRALTLEGRGAAPLELVTGDERERFLEGNNRDWPADRVVVVRPRSALQTAATYTLRLRAGVVAGEGPLATTRDIGSRFTTHGPFRVRSARLVVEDGWYDAIASGDVELSNSLPEDLELEGLVTVSPSPGELEVRNLGESIRISGEWQRGTAYRVTLAPGLVDAYGQRLVRRDVLPVTVVRTPGVGEVLGPARQVVVLGRDERRELPLEVIDEREVRVRLAPVPRDRLHEVLRRLDERGRSSADGLDLFLGAGLSPTKRTLRVTGPASERTPLAVPLGEVLPAGRSGAALVEVTDPTPAPCEPSPYHPCVPDSPLLYVVQATDLGMLAAVDERRLVVRALSSSTGAPVAGAQVEVERFEAPEAPRLALGTTDARGVVQAEGAFGGALILRVSQGDDSAFGLIRALDEERLPGLVFLDRDPYRPGETIRARLVARRHVAGGATAIEPPPPGAPVACELFAGTAWAPRDERETIATLRGQLDEFGAASFAYEIPEDARRGRWTIECALEGVGGSESFWQSFLVADFRAPPLELALEPPPARPHHLVGETVVFGLRGRFFHGAPAAGLPLRTWVDVTTARFEPPGHEGFSFGDGRWYHGEDRDERTLALDGAGQVELPIRLDGADWRAATTPRRVTLTAEVTDVTRHRVAASSSLLVQPASVAVGLRHRDAFAQGEPIFIDAVVVDLEGRRVGGRPVELTLRPRPPDQADDHGVEEEAVGSCRLTSGPEPLRCQVGPLPDGEYVVQARASDADGRTSTAETGFEVDAAVADVGASEAGSARLLVPERQQYRAGETARLTVRPPCGPARGLLTLHRAGLLDWRVVDAGDRPLAIDVPFTARFEGRVYAVLDLVAPAITTDTSSACFAGESPRAVALDDTLQVDVGADSRRLAVAVSPDRPRAAPGEPLGVEVVVRGVDGAPVDAEATVMVVDEAALALLGVDPPDLYRSMHRLESVPRSRRLGVFRRSIISEDEDFFGGLPELWMDDQPGSVIRLAAIEIAGVEPTTLLRDRFAATAFYSPAERTDAEGRVRVRFDLPDDVTRYRITAVAVDRTDRAGTGVSSVEVRRPLILRPGLPRFAALGDAFEITAAVHNETGREADVLVGLRAAGLALEGPALRSVRVRPGRVATVAFPVRVLGDAGEARVQLAASDGSFRDAVEAPLELRRPAARRVFAESGVLSAGGVRIPLAVPNDAWPDQGGLRVGLYTTALASLGAAAERLTELPYPWTEPVASRLVAQVALGQELRTGAVGPGDVEKTLGELLRLEQPGGGFGAAGPAELSSTSMSLGETAWAALALSRAAAAGHERARPKLDRSLDLLEQLFAERRDLFWEEPARWEQALALYALTRAGRRPRASHLELVWQARDTLPLDAIAWLLVAVHAADAGDPRADELLRRLRNAAVASPAGVRYAEASTEAGERLLWRSSSRTDAVVLDALLDCAPDDELVDATARALDAAQQRGGGWTTTQENAWSLIALSRYHAAREAEPPALTVGAWLGPRSLGQVELVGWAPTVGFEGVIPLARLLEVPGADLGLSFEGRGRLYYGLVLEYARSAPVEPIEQGLVIDRVYEAIDRPDDVRLGGDGAWRIRAGATVLVRLTLIVPEELGDVALLDPLPGGLEPLELAFLTGAQRELYLRRHGGDEPPACDRCAPLTAPLELDHHELRDDGFAALVRRAPPGVFEASYLARATTRGRFGVPPARAEALYTPGVLGSTGSAMLVVE